MWEVNEVQTLSVARQSLIRFVLSHCDSAMYSQDCSCIFQQASSRLGFTQFDAHWLAFEAALSAKQ